MRAFATRLGLYWHYEGQEVGGAHRSAQGFGDGGAEQQEREQVFRAVGAVDHAGFLSDAGLVWGE